MMTVQRSPGTRRRRLARPKSKWRAKYHSLLAHVKQKLWSYRTIIDNHSQKYRLIARHGVFLCFVTLWNIELQLRFNYHILLLYLSSMSLSSSAVVENEWFGPSSGSVVLTGSTFTNYNMEQWACCNESEILPWWSPDSITISQIVSDVPQLKLETSRGGIHCALMELDAFTKLYFFNLWEIDSVTCTKEAKFVIVIYLVYFCFDAGYFSSKKLKRLRSAIKFWKKLKKTCYFNLYSPGSKGCWLTSKFKEAKPKGFFFPPSFSIVPVGSSDGFAIHLGQL